MRAILEQVHLGGHFRFYQSLVEDYAVGERDELVVVV